MLWVLILVSGVDISQSHRDASGPVRQLVPAELADLLVKHVTFECMRLPEAPQESGRIWLGLLSVGIRQLSQKGLQFSGWLIIV